MSSIHGLKDNKKNITRSLRLCHAKKHDLSLRIAELNGALLRVNTLILLKRGKKLKR